LANAVWPTLSIPSDPKRRLIPGLREKSFRSKEKSFRSLVMSF
jgi:hypothetical protein